MFSVHFVFLFILSNVCQGDDKALMSNLIPIYSRRAEIRHSSFGQGLAIFSDGPCTLMQAQTPLEDTKLYVDLYTDYPIVLISFNLKKPPITSLTKTPISVKVNITIDNSRYWIRQIFYNKSEHHLNPVTKGRVITITTREKISLCSIQVYTCRSGKQGKTCENDCPLGTFGIACSRTCSCPNQAICNSVTGSCPRGCGDWPYDVSKSCPDHLVGSANKDFFRRTSVPIITVVHGPTTNIWSSAHHHPGQRCFDVSSKCESKNLFIDVIATAPINLYGIAITFTRFQIPFPYSISLKIDAKVCNGKTIENEEASRAYRSSLRKTMFKCHRNNTKGKIIRLEFTTYNKTAFMKDKGVGVRVCDLHVFECERGFYGSNCRQICACSGSNCDRETGACLHQKCNARSRGKSCSQLDVTFESPVFRKYYENSILTNFRRSGVARTYFDNDIGQNVSWLAVQLDTDYFINSITLNTKELDEYIPRDVSVFTETGLQIDDVDIRQRKVWRGLPCVAPKPKHFNGLMFMDIVCFGLTRTLIIVEATNSSQSYLHLWNIKVWVCVDGMFGPDCRHRCNCQNPTELCNKGTGECLSGCAHGYKGIDCLTPCTQDDPDPICPTSSCHCWGDHMDKCGPVQAICSVGCQDGYFGIDCNLTCPRGYYGHQCQYQCGDCAYGEGDDDATCLYTNGTCPFGCANEGYDGPTCTNQTAPTLRTTLKPIIEPGGRDDRIQMAVEESSFRVIMGLIGIIVACTSMVILVCCSLKCYWDRLSHSKKLNEKRVDLIMRRAMRAQIDQKVQQEHQQYHEEYLRRDMNKADGHSVDLPLDPHLKGPKRKAKAEAIRRMILEMEAQRRMRLTGRPGDDDYEEEEEQDPNEKVALWVLKQDFNELIERRKRRLKDYIGNPLTMTESPYRISETSVIKDVHKLYDDLEELAIP